MNSETTKLVISINDGYVEYSMLIDVPDTASIHGVASAIRAIYNQPPPGIDEHSPEPPLVLRQSHDFKRLLDKTGK